MRDEVLIRLLTNELSQLIDLNVSILTHEGGDPDSICSAYCLKKILGDYFKVGNVWIAVPDDPTAHTRILLDYFQVELNYDIENANAFIVVDAGSPEQLGKYSEVVFEESRRIVVIDHHSNTMNKYPPSAKVYSNESYQSVSEIIYDLAQYVGFEFSLRELEGTLIGMYYDTARFSIADLETSTKICRLINKGIILKDILARMEQSIDISERIARLKGATRMRVYRFGDWLIAITRVGKFQSSVARSLVSLGAHLAVAIGEADKSKVVAAIRASQDFVERTKINVGVDLAEKIGVRLGGHGGGHASAAHLECRVAMDELINHIVNELTNWLNMRPEVLIA